MKILILGDSISGNAAKKLADALNFDSTIVKDGGSLLPNFEFVDLLVVSPGVGELSPILMEAKRLGIEIASELEFGYRYFPKSNQVISITGTNGKTTTTELVAHILSKLGKQVSFAGNIGLPLSQVSAGILSGELPQNLIVVVEVSSFQLEYVRDYLSDCAVILNIESDHLNRYHGDFELYRATKLKIFEKMAKDKCFWGISSPLHETRRVSYIGDDVYFDGERLLNLGETQLRGGHNLENLIAALELLSVVLNTEEMKSKALIEATKSFSTGRHRLEKVNFRGGVICINDSKSTNTASTIAAVKSVAEQDKKNILLILGGLDKEMDFSPLREYVGYLKKCYLIGEAKDKFFALLGDVVHCQKFDSFEDCLNTIKQEVETGEIVLLSPACASMDMFKNYQDRGDQFVSLMQKS